ncbi:protealysin inhibitor emfourin [Streptomyces sp. NPDC028635]|uniref:protealysin inhibitor emfourin n=1 Tax=Streptomyces sp. NPDC028635 TaxID=3154800 RepID=UPI0033F7C4EA
MRVTLATHGGQAAALRLGLPPEVLDTGTLPANTAAELAELVAAASSAADTATGIAAESERPPTPNRARDAMSYTVTLETGGRTTVLTQSDTTMTPEFAALLDWLEQHFAQR